MFSSLEDKSSEIIITLNREKSLTSKSSMSSVHDVYRSIKLTLVPIQYSSVQFQKNTRKCRVRVVVYGSIMHGR
jgi:hypothetical protein